ncbi:LOW QUALITY PROTEIN: hypothetical protein HID58_033733 [Brassica napus]|uniref:Uncharacterized protein n=1 Tax=Brassica napus TaxID=3708 RepID=A0ABQ8C034_BRANA|nr:LOW QUALITY PROTEIN: hypothetical protein HID58_033733 [Brassica napus]
MRRERSLINHHWTKDCTWMMMMKEMMKIESFLQSRYKRGRGSVGPRMDENVPYLPTGKVDQLQSFDTRERKFLAKNKSECLQEEWGVLEKSPEAALDVDQTIFVVVAEDVERSKTTVLWAARNFSSKKICLLYVHLLGLPPAVRIFCFSFFLT